MSEQDRNNPLHGVGLDEMFAQLLRHYHWEILSEQLKFKCLENHPSFAATTKFLKKTPWAREKAEAFYLYRFKQLPIPSDEEHLLPPRERTFASDVEVKEPAAIKAGDKQFFDDPISGPKFSDGKFADNRFSEKKRSASGSSNQEPGDKKPYDKPSRTRAPAKPRPRSTESSDSGGDSSDPWGKWKKSSGEDGES